MKTIKYLTVGVGVLLFPYYVKRNGVMGGILLGLTLLNLWQQIPPHRTKTV